MTSTLRPVLGASFGSTRTIPIIPPDPDHPPRLDPEVALVATSDDEWTITLGIPAYSLSEYNLLAEVRAYLVPEGNGLPLSAQGYLESSYPFAAIGLSGTLDGLSVVVPLPEVPEGKFYGQLVKMYDDSFMPPSNQPETPPSEPPASEGDQPL